MNTYSSLLYILQTCVGKFYITETLVCFQSVSLLKTFYEVYMMTEQTISNFDFFYYEK